MSQIPRRSSVAQSSTQIPRRSSSIEGYSFSAQQLAMSQNSRPSMGRASSIGRPSMAGTKANEAKPVNTHDLAQSIINVLMSIDNSPTMTVKTLLLPSTGTFYTLFEFLLKAIGINDVWNPNLLITAAPNSKNPNQPLASSQPQQPNAIAQNKARIELIIYHLTVLKYTNVPKQNILQTMTTPKNWAHMLQILAFLANDCQFLNIYDAAKILFSFDKDKELINDYLKKAYSYFIQGYEFINTSEHKKMKEEALKRFENSIRGTLNIRQLESEKENLIKQYEFFDNTKNEYEDLLSEEQEILRQISEEENLLGSEKAKYEEGYKRLKLSRKELHALKEKLKQAEESIAIKDAEYDKQLASGKQMDNLPIKHAQKAQELDNLQTVYVDLEAKKDELHMKLLQKTQEAKDIFTTGNEIVNKIIISSSVSLDLFPSIEVIDLHKNNEKVKEYKEQIHKIRDNYNTSMCKLHSELSKRKEEKKMIEAKNEQSRSKEDELNKENKNYECLIQTFKKGADDVVNDIKKKYNDLIRKLNEFEKQEKAAQEEFLKADQNFKREFEIKNKIVESAKNEHDLAMKELENKKHKAVTELEEIEKNKTQILEESKSILKQLENLITGFKI